MTWTATADKDQRCHGSHGAVKDSERVARLMHSRNLPPEYEPFQRKEFYPPKQRPIKNECGNSDGVSLTRCDLLSDSEIRKRSESLAGDKRDPEGALIARVDSLRKLRLPHLLDLQPLFVYDDPGKGDGLHAVMRCSQAVPATDFDFLRNELKKSFADRLEFEAGSSATTNTTVV